MALYYNILYLMVRDYRETEAAQEEIQDSRRLDALSKITTYMREHYTEELKLSEMANLFGYSDAYLSRMFKKYAKINFKTYFTGNSHVLCMSGTDEYRENSEPDCPGQRLCQQQSLFQRVSEEI